MHNILYKPEERATGKIFDIKLLRSRFIFVKQSFESIHFFKFQRGRKFLIIKNHSFILRDFSYSCTHPFTDISLCKIILRGNFRRHILRERIFRSLSRIRAARLAPTLYARPLARSRPECDSKNFWIYIEYFAFFNGAGGRNCLLRGYVPAPFSPGICIKKRV